MKFKNLKLSAVAAAVLAGSSFVTTAAHAEISASVGVANKYLWRGVDLGQGDAAVSGQIDYSTAGFYTGVWASSGDAELGSEYDYFIGYGGAAGGFSYDVSYWTYIYPSSDIDFGDAADLVISLGFAGVGLTVFENLEDDGAGSRYINLGYSFDKYGISIGQHDTGEITSEHIQLDYSYNDNLSFAASKFLDDDLFDDDVQFLVSYSIPLK